MLNEYWHIHQHNHRDEQRVEFVISTPPAVEPLEPADVYSQLRIDGTTEFSDLLTTYIKAARAMFESYTNRSFVTQTLTTYLSRFPDYNRSIILPRPALQTVTFVKYYDTDGNIQTWDPANYTVFAEAWQGRLEHALAAVWPRTAHRRDAVQIEHVCGYGDAVDVPEVIKLAMKLQCQQWFDEPTSAMKELSPAVCALLDTEKVTAL
jgi:uncharacterized phiE125 gp8 family phage protein